MYFTAGNCTLQENIFTIQLRNCTLQKNTCTLQLEIAHYSYRKIHVLYNWELHITGKYIHYTAVKLYITGNIYYFTIEL